MRYTVILEPTKEADNPGWYYAHIPALDLTTHGFGLDGAMEAAQDLAAGWLAELKRQGTPIPVEQQSYITILIQSAKILLNPSHPCN